MRWSSYLCKEGRKEGRKDVRSSAKLRHATVIVNKTFFHLEPVMSDVKLGISLKTLYTLFRDIVRFLSSSRVFDRC